MSDSERDGPGDGRSSDERDPVPELSGHEPLPEDADSDVIDREFARIVAGWDDVAPGFDGPVGPWSAAEDVVPRDSDPDGPHGVPDVDFGASEPGPDRRTADLDSPGPAPTSRHRAPGTNDGSRGPRHRVVREPTEPRPPVRPEIWRGPTAPLDPDTQPEGLSAPGGEDVTERYVPPDPPPLGGDIVSRLSWAAVLGGPLFLVFAVLFWRELPHLLMLAALAAFVGGFVALVARMPRDRDPGDDDDGAVV
jgi:hypothetical protein